MTDPKLDIHYITSGNNIVEAAGHIGEGSFYFRGFGMGWQFIADDMAYSGEYDNAGHMPQYVALELIADCIRRYIEGEQD